MKASAWFCTHLGHIWKTAEITDASSVCSHLYASSKVTAYLEGMEHDGNPTIDVGGEPLVCDPTLACEAPALRNFLELWEALSKIAGGVPPRRAMTARVLKNYLTDLLLVERVETGDGLRFRVRIVGTRISSVTGDVTGKFINEFVPPELLPRWTGVSERVLGGGRPLRFKGRVLLNDKTNLMAEYVSAPLADEQGQATMVLTVFALTDTSQLEPAMSALRKRLSEDA